MTHSLASLEGSRPGEQLERALPRHERCRVLTLQRLVQALQSFPAEAERQEFSRLFFHAQSVLEIDDTELASALRVSIPTIGRWASGQSAPHPFGRGPVLLFLADLAESKLKRHPGYSREGSTPIDSCHNP